MSQRDHSGGKFPGHVIALLSGARNSASSAPPVSRDQAAIPAPSPEVREPTSVERKIVRRRRGVSIDTMLTLMLISAGIGAAAWEIYGEKVRSKIGGIPHTAPLASAPSVPLPGPEAAWLGTVQELQERQKRVIDQLETILKSQASQQTIAKTTSEALAALNAKIDTLQPPAPKVLTSKPAPAAPRRQTPKPRSVRQEQVDQPQPPPDATDLGR
jgi:hypothetical protein